MLFKFFFIFFLLINCSLHAFEGEFDIARWKNIIQDIKNKAIQQKISQKTIKRATSYSVFIPSVIHSDKNQAEFKITLTEYLNRIITKDKILYGQKQRKKYKTILSKASNKFKVQKKVLLAFWGMESDFGRFKQEHRLTDVFWTMLYNGRRKTFFEKQLLALMKISDKYNLDISEIHGSWAGAMGHFQFIPTTLILYGMDGNGDKKIDINNSISDAMFSAGNYLHKLGWNQNEKIIREVKLPVNLDFSLLNTSDKKTVTEWKKLGIKDINNMPLTNSNIKAGLLVENNNGYIGRAFLTYPNFYRIKRWNNSNWYAIAIAIFADKLQ